MPRNVRRADLCTRLLAPFPPLLEEAQRLLHATVAEEQAAELHPPALHDPAVAKR